MGKKVLEAEIVNQTQIINVSCYKMVCTLLILTTVLKVN
jgi:hypothetical protein